MSRLFVIACLLLSSFAASAEVLRLHGSNTIGAALMPSLVEAWLPEQGYRITQKQNPQAQEVLLTAVNDAGDELRVEISSHGSSTAFRGLASGQADVGMSSRRISRQEVLTLNNMGPLDQAGNEVVLALDAVAVVVHPNNPLRRLTVQQVQDVFSGKTRNWRSLSGNDLAVQLYARDDQSGTYEVFRQEALAGKALSSQARRYESSAELVNAVARDPAAIGFVSLAYVKGVRALAIQEADVAVEPTPFQVATEDFPLARRLYLYAPEVARSPLVNSLIEFALGELGQDIAAKTGYVSQNVFAEDMRVPSTAPAEYRQLTQGAQRLSLNFRFDERAFQLDAKAEHDLDRLAEYLKQMQPKPKDIMLLGFSDPYEAAPVVSVGLASDRADYIASALFQRDVVATRVRGYGSVAAVASNEDVLGRLKNRRVEVWVR
jgi:phosphate transport system substrate-binding protein